MINNYNIFDYIRNNITVLDVAKKFPIFFTTLVKQGKDYGTNCPTGHHSESGTCFKITGKDFYICHSCGISGGAFNLAALLLENDELKPTIEWFVRTFSLDEGFLHKSAITKSPEEVETERILNINTLLYEYLIDEGKRQLFQEKGKTTLQYLTETRKYSEEVIAKTEFFYLPIQIEAKDQLRKAFPHFTKEIANLKLVGHYGDSFRFAIPYRNRYGKITGLLKRADKPEGYSGETYLGETYQNKRWDSTPQLTKDDLFGLHRIKKGSTDTLLAVEGYPDVEYIQALGYTNIVGAGQGILSENYIEGLKQKQIKNIVLSLDNDKVGPANTAKAIELLFKHRIYVLVVPPGELGAYKDPDEFVVANGIDALEHVVNKAEEAEKWMIEWIYSLHPNNPLGKNKAMLQSMDFAKLIFNPLGKTLFIEALSKKSGITKRILERDINNKQKEAVKPNTRTQTKSDKGDKSVSADDMLATVTELKNSILFPFQERKTLDWYIWDRADNSLVSAASRDRMENMCNNEGIVLPPVIPIMRIVFNPDDFEKINIPERTINMCTPTKYMQWTKNDEIIDLEKQCPSHCVLVKNLTQTEEMFHYFLNWLAYCFQFKKLSKTAWIFMGTHGTGKGVLFEHVIIPFVGLDNVSVVNAGDIQDKYNRGLMWKLFVAFNEIAVSNEDRNNTKGFIKAYITEERITTKEKFMKELTTQNRMNCIFYANEDLPVVIERGDRRFNVVHCNTTLQSVAPNWNDTDVPGEAFINALADEREDFYRYLINLNVNIAKATRCISSEDKDDLEEASMTRFEAFGKALIAEDPSWFNEQIEAKNIQKRKTPLDRPDVIVTEEDLNDGRIIAMRAVQIFMAIYPETYNFSMNLFTRHLKPLGIKRETYEDPTDNTRKKYYQWRTKTQTRLEDVLNLYKKSGES